MKCSLIVNELRYGKLQLVTDLLFLTSKNIVSIEIKTDKDDLRRLENQIAEAKKNFNKIIVFAAEKHLKSLLLILPSEVGITIMANNKIKIVRHPKRFIVEDEELLYSMPSNFLKKSFFVPASYNSDQTRDFILSQPHSKINCVYRNYLIDKYGNKFKIFLSDRGTETHIEDIPLLSIGESVENKL